MPRKHKLSGILLVLRDQFYKNCLQHCRHGPYPLDETYQLDYHPRLLLSEHTVVAGVKTVPCTGRPLWGAPGHPQEIANGNLWEVSVTT